MIVWVPSVGRSTISEKAPSTSATLCPFSVTLWIGLASVTVPVTRIDVSAVIVPSSGAVIVTTGGIVSSTTSIASVAVPDAFTPLAVSVFGPSLRGTSALKVPPLTWAEVPFTSTATPVPSTVPSTSAGVAASSAPSSGAVIRMRGASPERPIFEEPSGPWVSWMRTPSTQPWFAAPATWSTVSPGPVSTKLADSTAPLAPPASAMRRPQSQFFTGAMLFPPPTFQTLFAWNCHWVMMPDGSSTPIPGTRLSSTTFPKRPSRSPSPGGIEAVTSTASPPGASVKTTVT